MDWTRSERLFKQSKTESRICCDMAFNVVIGRCTRLGLVHWHFSSRARELSILDEIVSIKGRNREY